MTAQEPWDWPEGDVLVRRQGTTAYYVVVDGNGEPRGAFRVGPSTLQYHPDCTGAPVSRRAVPWRDATRMWPQFPAWVRTGVTRCRAAA